LPELFPWIERHRPRIEVFHYRRLAIPTQTRKRSRSFILAERIWDDPYPGCRPNSALLKRSVQEFGCRGVIGDAKESGLKDPLQPELFVSYLQGTVKDNRTPSNKLFLFVKTDYDPLSFANAARKIVQSLDPEQPVADVATMQQRLKASLSMQQFQLDLFGGFAAVWKVIEKRLC
jgi:hypothetical protein